MNLWYHIGSGGGPGMMQAANEGAYRAGGRSVGFGISVPFEQGLNPYVTQELAFEFRSALNSDSKMVKLKNHE